MNQEDAATLRAIASDCSRVADDYTAEGLTATGDAFREHAASLWLIAGRLDTPTHTAEVQAAYAGKSG